MNVSQKQNAISIMKGFTWKNLAIAAGVAMVVLAIVDSVYQFRDSSFGIGVSSEASQVAGSTIAAFILVGMIVGMVGGIALAFTYFMWKEKKLEAQPDDLTKLFEELSRDEALYVDDYPSYDGDEKSESLEPWERPTDWWKRDED